MTDLDKAIEVVERRRDGHARMAALHAERNGQWNALTEMYDTFEDECEAILIDLRALKEKEKG